MNCPGCQNHIVCETDPENTEYKYILGAKKFVN
jgi:hypothetical protein